MRKQYVSKKIGVGNGYENVIYYSISEADKKRVLWSDTLDALMMLRLVTGIPYSHA